MTKIAVGSDLHVEFGEWPKLPDKDTDILLLAGDTGTYTAEQRWMRELQDRIDAGLIVFGIPGNHTGYDKTPWDGIEQTKSIYTHKLHIAGCTLWTDFNLNDDPDRAMLDARHCMNDYYKSVFSQTGIPLRPIHTQEWHYQHVSWLGQVGGVADIILTHHAPSAKSINARYHGYPDSVLNPCFASNLDWLVEQLAPKYWIHGHMHDPTEYKIGETTVLCNPKGYPRENPHWDWLYLEVE